MKIKLITIGKNKQAFIKAGILEYQKRISPFLSLELIELPDVSLSKTNNIEIVKKKEAEILQKKILPTDFVVCLDEKGQNFTSLQFARFIGEKLNLSGDLVFIVGGVYGLAKNISENCDLLLSFSRFTFTHQMIRLIFLEQLYRAITILKGKQYHY
jgi:23S rRNA (pseudouridine1915-N3)-methyltransferase